MKSRIIVLSLCLVGALAAPAAALTATTAEVENAAPIAENLTLNTYKGVAISSRFAAVDPEGDLVTFQIVDSPARGQVTLDENDPAAFWYTPYEGKKGKDSFTYVAIDDKGNQSEPATVKITIEKQKTTVSYSDLDGNSAHYAALRLAEAGVYTGRRVGDLYCFEPDGVFSREEFLTMAMTMGLDLPIMNPNAEAMMAAVRCYHLLMNIDTDARDYIAAYGNAAVTTSITAGGTPQAAAPAGERSLAQIVEAGLKGEAGPAARKLLETADPMEVVNDVLIPALDRVGAGFEAGKVFLPQLIQAAGAAQAAFEVIREKLAAQPGGEEVSRPPIVLATVKGDIHDIGKNIVKVLLENYGYPVIDLGKDVEPAAVAEAAKKHKSPLVGLSALMTTTLGSMEATIRLLREEGVPCKVVVGGAVLTADFAKKIGADFYARDAKESVDVARQVIG